MIYHVRRRRLEALLIDTRPSEGQFRRHRLRSGDRYGLRADVLQEHGHRPPRCSGAALRPARERGRHLTVERVFVDPVEAAAEQQAFAQAASARSERGRTPMVPSSVTDAARRDAVLEAHGPVLGRLERPHAFRPGVDRQREPLRRAVGALDPPCDSARFVDGQPHPARRAVVDAAPSTPPARVNAVTR